jgi:hypothetical protein
MPDEKLNAEEIAERRADPEFRARLERSVEENRELLERLEPPDPATIPRRSLLKLLAFAQSQNELLDGHFAVKDARAALARPDLKPATQKVPHQPIDDKVEAFRKKFFERTGDRLQRTAVVEGLRAALEPCETCGGSREVPRPEPYIAQEPQWEPCPDCTGGQALEPVGEEPEEFTVSLTWHELDGLLTGQAPQDHRLDGWITGRLKLRDARDGTCTSLYSVGQPEDERESTEEPCDCDPDMRIASDCDRLGCREARRSGAVQPDCQTKTTEEGR